MSLNEIHSCWVGVLCLRICITKHTGSLAFLPLLSITIWHRDKNMDMLLWFCLPTLSPRYRSFRKTPLTSRHKWTCLTSSSRMRHWESIPCTWIPKSISETPLTWQCQTPICHSGSMVVIFCSFPTSPPPPCIQSPLFSVRLCAPEDWLLVDVITQAFSQLASASGKPWQEVRGGGKARLKHFLLHALSAILFSLLG